MTRFLINFTAFLSVFALPIAAASAEEKLPPVAEIEASGAVIGQIVFERKNVFDTTLPGENKSLFRLANRWHVVTRGSVIGEQLLFASGDRFSARLLAESERILRQNAYLYDARIEPLRFADGTVDIRVWTRDLWTLMPGISLSRSGGENRARVSISERNLLGNGVAVRLAYVENVDRDSLSFQYGDRNVRGSRVSVFTKYADSSDGDTTDLRLIRPFYSLDSRWSAGGTFFDESREVSFYDLGQEAAEYREQSELHSAFFGRSSGLDNAWVKRWTVGLVYDEKSFSTVIDGTLPSLLPADRKLVYPFVGYEILQDKYESTSNRESIERTEDFLIGARVWTSIGYATEGLGSDRESFIYRIDASRGFGSIARRALLLSSSLSGRVDDGNSANAELSLNIRYYNQISDKRLFYMTLDASRGSSLDLDNVTELGGDTGLRGYPLRYQTGDSRLLFSAEQRYFTDWYPFRLARVGGAVFADVGRTWGDNPLGAPSIGWLKDVGIGLRLVPTRSSGRDVIHFDIAFPLDGDSSIDDVQFLLESKRSF